jgi:alkyl hydroperoxide reductase subunit D
MSLSLESLIESIPGYAKDLKLNYSTLVRQNTELTPQQLWGTVLVSALATRNLTLTAAVEAAAAAHMPPAAIDGAKTAAAIMGMNNIYYRFLHLSSNEKYTTMPARLRMNGMRTHGIDHVDFELWSLAVSAINGCGKCVDAHEQVLRDKGVVEDLILAVIRIASIMHAIGVVLEAESATRAAVQAVQAHEAVPA